MHRPSRLALVAVALVTCGLTTACGPEEQPPADRYRIATTQLCDDLALTEVLEAQQWLRSPTFEHEDDSDDDTVHQGCLVTDRPGGLVTQVTVRLFVDVERDYPVRDVDVWRSGPGAEHPGHDIEGWWDDGHRRSYVDSRDKTPQLFVRTTVTLGNASIDVSVFVDGAAPLLAEDAAIAASDDVVERTRDLLDERLRS